MNSSQARHAHRRKPYLLASQLAVKRCAHVLSIRQSASLNNGAEKAAIKSAVNALMDACLQWRRAIINFGFFENLASVVFASLSRLRQLLLQVTPIITGKARPQLGKVVAVDPMEELLGIQ